MLSVGTSADMVPVNEEAKQNGGFHTWLEISHMRLIFATEARFKWPRF